MFSLVSLVGVCLAANELDVPTKGHFFAGDFSFSFTVKEGSLDARNKEDVLAVYYGEFCSQNLFSNGFVLRYDPATGGATLTAGRGCMNQVGSAARPEISGASEYVFHTGDSVTFRTPLKQGQTYTVTNKGADGKQTVTLSGADITPEKKSYNGNMNGGKAHTQMNSMFNAAYDSGRIRAITTNNLDRKDNGNYKGFRFCLSAAEKNARIRLQGLHGRKPAKMQLESLAIRMGNRFTDSPAMSAVLVDALTKKILGYSNRVNVQSEKIARIKFNSQTLDAGKTYAIYFSSKSEEELARLMGQVIPSDFYTDFRFSARSVGRSDVQAARTWGWINEDIDHICCNSEWAPAASMQLIQVEEPVAVYETDELSDNGVIWRIVSLSAFIGALLLLGFGIWRLRKCRKQQPLAESAPAGTLPRFLPYGMASGALLLVAGLCCLVEYFSPVAQLKRAGYTSNFAEVGLFRAATEGDESLLKNLINAGVNVQKSNPAGWSALHCAALGGHRECARMLKEATDWSNTGWSALHLAIVTGDETTAKRLIRRMGKSDVPMDSGHTSLHLAAALGYTNILRRVLQKEHVNPNMADAKGNTALHYAVMNGHADCVAKLLEYGNIQANRRNAQNQTPIHLAVQNGDPDCVQTLIMSGKCQLDVQDNQGNSLLHLAVQHAHPATLECLIKSGKINVNHLNQAGWSALTCAAGEGRTKCLKVLLQAPGINVNACGSGASSALQEACRTGMDDCVSLLLEVDGIDVNYAAGWKKKTALQLAARKGKVKNVNALLNHDGIDVNLADYEGFTPLHIAALKNRAAVVARLIEHEGIKLDAVDNAGRTPLLVALNECAADAAELLINAGSAQGDMMHAALIAAIDLKNTDIFELLLKKCTVDDCLVSKEYGHKYSRNRSSLLEYAVSGNYVDGVRLIMKKAGTQIKSFQDEDANNLLLLCARSGKAELVELVLDSELFDINATNCVGASPLRCAVTANSPDTVRMLLEQKGVDVNKANNDGNTALHKAAAKGYAECMKLLLDADGINVHVKNNAGETPMYWALREIHTDCCVQLHEAGARFGSGDSALTLAVLTGDDDKVRRLIGKGTGRKHPERIRNLTCLAVQLNQPGCLAALLKSEHADVNATFSNHAPLLYQAAERGYTDCVRILMGSEGIDPNVGPSDRYRRSPLAIAVKNGHEDCANLIIKHDKTVVNHAVIEEYVRSGNEEPLRKLFAERGYQALAWYAWTQILEDDAAELLSAVISHPQFETGKLPAMLEWTMRNQCARCLRVLLADKRCDTSSLPQAVEAVLRQDTQTLRELADGGYDFTAKDATYYCSLLRLAVRLNLTETVQTLLSIPGIDANSTADDYYGNSLLGDAAVRHHIDMVELLLRVPGIKVNAKNTHNRTAYDLVKDPSASDNERTRERKAACAELIQNAMK